MVHRDFLRLHVMGRFRIRHEALDRRALLQSLFACGVAAALPVVPTTAFAQAAPVLKGFEQALGNSIGRWTGRISAIGVAANDNAVRLAVTEQLVATGVARGAPFLRVVGPFLGPLGRVLALAASAYLVADLVGSLARVVHPSDGSASDTESLIDQLGPGGFRVVDGQTWFVTKEPYGYSFGKYASKGFDFFYQRNSPEPEPGYKLVLWHHASASPPAVPIVEPDTAVEALSLEDRGRSLAPQSVADLVNSLLASAHAASPTTVPDPALNPVTVADVDPLTVGQLAEASDLSRDVALGGSSSGGDGGDGGEGGEGGITWPSWPVTPWDEPGHDFGLPAFQFPSLSMPTGGECPKLTGSWKGNEVTMDPCPIATTARPMVSSLSTFLYWFAALRVMFASK